MHFADNRRNVDGRLNITIGDRSIDCYSGGYARQNPREEKRNRNTVCVKTRLVFFSRLFSFLFKGAYRRSLSAGVETWGREDAARRNRMRSAKVSTKIWIDVFDRGANKLFADLEILTEIGSAAIYRTRGCRCISDDAVCLSSATARRIVPSLHFTHTRNLSSSFHVPLASYRFPSG